MFAKKKDNINPQAHQLLHKSAIDVETTWKQLRKNDRTALGKAITCIESRRPQDRENATWLLKQCPPQPVNNIRIGITGAPGSGKSTLINALSFELHKSYDPRMAILTIDPSSKLSGGSILGDQTRMENLVTLDNVFLRSSPSKGYLGGVNPYTRETITLCEAAGFNTILIETVGVGQSEIEISDMVDIFILVLTPGAGDELQGIKRGIIEMADILVINKADGNYLNVAEETAREYRHALSILQKNHKTYIHLCSAIDRTGLLDIKNSIVEIEKDRKESNQWWLNRQDQKEKWFNASLQNQWVQLLLMIPHNRNMINKYHQAIHHDEISPVAAAVECIEQLQMTK